MTTELAIAKAISVGGLPSPTQFLNSSFYRVRFSGTGVAWRPAEKEFVYRPPKIWLSSEMCERVSGVPVVAEHPESLALDGKSFFDSIVALCMLGFVQGDELMTIIRVIDARACKILDDGQFDSSPGVIFEPGANTKLQIGDDVLLIEESPALIDHLALVNTSGGNAGVWTKPGGAPGVTVDETATERTSS